MSKVSDVNQASKFSFLDIPGIFVVIVFAMVWISIFVFVWENHEKKGSRRSLTLKLLPFVLAFIILPIGYLISFDQHSKALAAISVFLILWIAVRTLKFTLNPLGALNSFLYDLLKGEKTLVEQIPSEELEKDMKSMTENGKVDISDLKEMSIWLKCFTLGMSSVVGSSKTPLIFFLTYYAVSIFLTLLLMGLVVKGIYLGGGELGSFDYMLSGFFCLLSGSDVASVVGGQVSPLVIALGQALNLFYFVLALLAFSTVAGESSAELRERMQILLNREVMEIKWRQLEKMSGKKRHEFK